MITTPHIMSDIYPNTKESLTAAFDNFTSILRSKGYSLSFHLAAEYYLDEHVYGMANDKSLFLTFGKEYLLFETNPITEPFQLKEFVFALTVQGVTPVLAHPERYQYMTIEKAADLRDRGVLFQVNIPSLGGFYGPAIQKQAEMILNQKWIDFLGSDCHNPAHLPFLMKSRESKLYHKATELPLLNYTI